MALSDNATITMPVAPAYQAGGYGMWGGDLSSWFTLFLIFGMFGGWGWGNGWGGNGGSSFGTPYGQGWATRADINEGFALNGLQNGQRDITAAITNGFHGVDNAVCQLGYNVQQGINTLSSQLADCCCTTQRAIDGVNYNMATQASGIQNAIQNTTRDIIDNQTSGINAIMGKLSQMEYNGLNDKYQAALAENQALKFQASQTAQNAFITANQEAQTAELLRRLGRDCPVPAYVVPNPNCCYNPNGAMCA